MEKCLHPSNKLTKIYSSEGCVFCQSCGLILYPAKSNKYINTIKPYENQSKTETDPIELFINAYKETPFNIISKDSIYFERRSRAIKILEKFNNLYHFKDEIFYLALTYMDYIFKSIYTNNKNKSITRKKEELYILNSLLISEKFYDKDVNDTPDYSIYIKNSIYGVDTLDIKENEIDCLKVLKYKLDHHSIYDILKGYMYNGFIFEKEIDSNLTYQIKFAYNYAEKLFRDIIYSYIAIIYPPYLISFVIIQLTRKKFFDSKYMKKIKKIYGIKQEDYKECYEDIKTFLKNVENGLKVSDYNKINKEKDKESDKEIKKKEGNLKEENGKNNDINQVNKINDITNNITNVDIKNEKSNYNVKNESSDNP